MTEKKLRDYQAAAIDAIESRYAAGITRLLLSGATGCGKTEIFSFLIKGKIAEGKKCLVLAHRDRLVTQAAARIEGVVGLFQVGLVNADRKQWHSPCVVATVQSAAIEKQLMRAPKFDVIIIDECHRSNSSSYKKVIDALLKPGGLLLGVTATPNRGDKKGLIPAVFEELVFEIGMQELIDKEHLSPVVGKEIKLPIDFSKIGTKVSTDGIKDYKPEEIQKAFEESDWLQKITAGWREVAADRRTIIFVPPGVVNDRACGMAHNLAEYMRLHGIPAAAVDGTTKQTVQDQVIADFTAGKLQVLVNVNIFTEGLDIPAIDCVLFARPTQSSIIYSQAIGRGTRLFPGKANCLVIDVTGITDQLAKDGQSLMSLGKVLPTKEQIEDEKRERMKRARQLLRTLWRKRVTLKILEEKITIEGDIKPKDLKLLRELEPEVFQILSKRDADSEEMGGTGERMPVNTNLLTGGDRIEIKDIDFTRAGMQFHWTSDPAARKAMLRHGDRLFIISRPDPAGPYLCYEEGGVFESKEDSYNDAKVTVERHIAKLELTKRTILDDPNAAWRFRPASDKQKDLLTKFKIPFPDDITKGEAANLLDRVFSKTKKRA